MKGETFPVLLDLSSLIRFICLGLLLCSTSSTMGQVAQMQQSAYQEVGVTQVSMETKTIDSSMLTGEVWVREIWKINKAGYITEITSYNQDKRVKLLVYNSYQQDSLIKDCRYIYQTSNGRRISDTEYIYDKRSRLRQMRHFSDNKLVSKSKYYYYKDGLLKKFKQRLYADSRVGTLNGKAEVKYYYDASRRVIGQSILRRSLTENYEMIYSADGLKKTTYKRTSSTTEKWLWEEREQNVDGQIISYVDHLDNPKTAKVTMAGIPYLRGDRRKTVFDYNALGLVTTETIYKNDILVQVKKYSYVFRE